MGAARCDPVLTILKRSVVVSDPCADVRVLRNAGLSVTPAAAAADALVDKVLEEVLAVLVGAEVDNGILAEEDGVLDWAAVVEVSAAGVVVDAFSVVLTGSSSFLLV